MSQQAWRACMPANSAATACSTSGNSVQLWDLNNMARVGEIPGAHKAGVRDVHYAANNDSRIVTGGEDGKVRFWDLRWVQCHAI